LVDGHVGKAGAGELLQAAFKKRFRFSSGRRKKVSVGMILPSCQEVTKVSFCDNLSLIIRKWKKTVNQFEMENSELDAFFT
jgi:hypothetical protein